MLDLLAERTKETYTVLLIGNGLPKVMGSLKVRLHSHLAWKCSLKRTDWCENARDLFSFLARQLMDAIHYLVQCTPACYVWMREWQA